nr:type I restriction endonuclease [uncultured Desulfobacter sp.]
MPLGIDGEHITIHLIDFYAPQNNHCVLSQQVQFTGARDCYFDLVLYVNGLPLVAGEVKTPVRDAISWQDGAADFLGGGATSTTGKIRKPFLFPTCSVLPRKEKHFITGP